MSSWQRVRFSLRFDTRSVTENVCWRCALRQTRQYSDISKASASKRKRFRTERQYVPTEMAADGQRDRGYDLRRQVIHKYTFRKAESARPVVSKVSSETRMNNVDKEGKLKYIKIGIGGYRIFIERTPQPQPPDDKISRPKIYRRTITPPLKDVVDVAKDESLREALKTGHRRMVLDSAVRYVQSPTKAQVARKPVEEEESQRALTDVLDAFDDLYARLGRDSPKLGAGQSLYSSMSAKANPGGKYIRSYATTAIRSAAHEPTAFSSMQTEPAIEIPLKKVARIRDQLRVWQEHEDATPHDLELHGFPYGRCKSQHNMLGQSSTSDNDSSFLLEDDFLDDETTLNSDAEDLVTDIGDNQMFLRSGDLVELLTSGGSMLAIYIRTFATQSQFYTIQGKWVHRSTRQVKFSISPFSARGAVDRIFPYLPSEEVVEEKLDRIHALDIGVPREAGAELVTKMSEFQRAANAVFREKSERLDRAYELLAHPTERRLVTTEEAAMKLLQITNKSRLTEPMLWAVHRILTSTGGFRMSNRDHRLSPIFDVLPQSDIEEISRVRQWLREYQEEVITNVMTGTDLDLPGRSKNPNPFYQFIANARSLIMESRKTRAVTASGTVGPSSVKISPVLPRWAVYKSKCLTRFDSSATQILEYMHKWVTTDTVQPNSSLASLGPMVLRAVGMYEGQQLRQDTGFMFLQEVGVIPPWQHRIAYNTTLNIPGHRIDPRTDRLLNKAKHSVANFETKDSMQHLRKDWGDLEVFCIDDADASERDDGISLEPVDGSDSKYWVHIHVANPSSFITPDSDMGRYAAHVTQSIYFPERRFPMFTPYLVEKNFSLANNTPSITFSAKIGADGEILETSITNGVLRNVRHLTRQTLRWYLSSEDGTPLTETANITVGGGKLGMGALPKSVIKQKATAETLNSLTKPQIAILRKLGQLGEARRRKRERDGAVDIINQQVPRPEPKVYFQALGRIPTLFDTHGGQHFEGDPIISFDYNHFDPTPRLKSSISETLVPDCMILAGEIAATWCGQRNIPIPYRGTLRNPEPAVPPEQFKKEVIDPAIARNGYAPLVASLRYLTLIGHSSLSTTPLRHAILGAPYYCKITSPLRRYTDLMAHWQIEAAIRHEAEIGTSLLGNTTNGSYLPFTRPEAEAITAHSFRREDVIANCSRGAARHWYTQLFFRAFYFKEAPLPETFQVYVVSLNTKNTMDRPCWTSISKDYGIVVALEENKVSAAVGGIKVGDWWEARIDRVQVYHRSVLMTPVRLIEKAEVDL